MSLVINHNMMAATAARNLGTAFASLGTSVRRLSSGLRVNTAADDAAGLAIREMMRADIAAINQGIRNANDAVSLLQTADGALGVIDEKLIRMKELAEQAATGTYNSTQRLIIDSEYQAMASEITRIANATKFNGIHLLNGNLSGATHDGSGLVSTGKMKIHFGTGNDSAEDYYYIQIGIATASALGFGSSSITTSAYASSHNLIAGPSDSLQSVFQSYGEPDAATRNQFSLSTTAQIYTTSGQTSPVYAFVDDTSGNTHALRFDVAGGTWSYTSDTNLSQSGGAASISTQQLAQQALRTIDNAIVSKDNIRAHLGALQNRFQNTITNLEIQAENLQAAESRISDVDVSLEMTEFVRNQILTQAAVAMLAQANSLPRMAMQLLGG